jgi:hypothetical protein
LFDPATIFAFVFILACAGAGYPMLQCRHCDRKERVAIRGHEHPSLASQRVIPLNFISLATVLRDTPWASQITPPSTGAKPALAGAVLAQGVASSQPAAAQSAACVDLLVGAGYAAWMAVKLADDFTSSSSFPIGDIRCINLPVNGMVGGAPYKVVASIVLGSGKALCTPTPGVTGRPAPIQSPITLGHR